MKDLAKHAIELLSGLIEIPSLSRNEEAATDFFQSEMARMGYTPERTGHNLVLRSPGFNPDKPTLLLNSHIDTVKPSASYTRNPHKATIEDGKLYGLGSNDAGGSLVSLFATFCHLSSCPQPYNLVYVASAEEEVSGRNGIELVFPTLGPVDFAIVGEPTKMQMAIAEKGLMVLDCTAKGKTGHAARNEGLNAIYEAIDDIAWLKSYRFPQTSELLGDIKMSVTLINAGTQHNVVPEKCEFVVDVRTNEKYSNTEVLEIIKSNIKSDVNARSTRINSSFTPFNHPIIRRGQELGLTHYGSPTTSDQALIPRPSIKIGPGDSARSHSADEYIYVHEIEEGIDTYIRLLDGLLL